MIQALLEAGLIQFGQFRRGSAVEPVRARLDMLPSYLEALNAVVDMAQKQITGSFSHILCPADAVGTAMALSLRAKIPLVYSRGGQGSAVDDLIGAYDIGHSTVLIANTSENTVNHLAQQAKQVGLDVKLLIVVLEIQPMMVDGMAYRALLRLRDLLDDPALEAHIPHGQRDAVREWLDNQGV